MKNNNEIKKVEKPIISVIMPVYNAEKFIEKTLQSVCNQTFKEIEIICVDDCSTDKSVELIEKMQKNDKRIRLLKNEQNSKVSKTRNFGISNANANWIALIDSDDLWKPEFLEETYNCLQKNSGLLCAASYDFISHEGECLDGSFIVPREISYRKLLKRNYISCSSVMVDKSLLLKYPFFADAVHEDYLCWLTILKDIKVAYGVEKILSTYRLTKGSKSRNKLKAIKMTYFTYKKHGLGFFSRCFYTLCNAINGLKKYTKIRKSRK